MMTQRRKVSVCMITYNHEKFIEQAVNSVLMQQTNFDFEVIIGEDCSTDRTREILVVLQKKHSDKIKLVLNPENIGMIPNFVKVLSMARGDYIALLEGDDYWTDPYKLQKQHDYLESSPEYVLVCSNVLQVNEEDPKGAPIVFFSQDEQSFDFGTAELMVKNPCPTLTVFFRNGLIKDFPELYFEGIGGDRPLYLLLSRFGQCRFVNEVTGVYRIHSGGATAKYRMSWLNRYRKLETSVKLADRWNQHFGENYREQVELARTNAAKYIVNTAIHNGRLGWAIRHSRFVNGSTLRRPRSRRVLSALQFLNRLFRSKDPWSERGEQHSGHS
jgi:glycosyltransferase involved in cell wall biosynthesis